MVEQSSEIGELAKALSRAQAKFNLARKTSVNPHFKSRFADMLEIHDACVPPLNEQGITVLQPTGLVGDRMVVFTTLAHSSGQWIRAAYPVEPVKRDPQSLGAALTYARRYGLAAMVCVVADDDDDGNRASQREERRPEPANDTRREEEPRREPPREATDDRGASMTDLLRMVRENELTDEQMREQVRRSDVDEDRRLALGYLISARKATTKEAFTKVASDIQNADLAKDVIPTVSAALKAMWEQLCERLREAS